MLDVIYINTLPDTNDFCVLFDRLDANILVNPTYEQVTELLSSSTNRLLICGHGNELGVFGEVNIVDDHIRWGDYCIDRSNVELLRQREVIGIWCFAGNFADRYGLHGFFTSMFISNVMEAADFGFTTDEETVRNENIFFSTAVRRLIDEDVPLSQWPEILQSEAHTDIPFVGFNYEALAYYE